MAIQIQWRMVLYTTTAWDQRKWRIPFRPLCKIFGTYAICSKWRMFTHYITEYYWNCVGCIDATAAIVRVDHRHYTSKTRRGQLCDVWLHNVMGYIIFCLSIFYVSYSHVRQNSELFFQVFYYNSKKLKPVWRPTGNHACVKYFLQIRNLYNKPDVRISFV